MQKTLQHVKKRSHKMIKVKLTKQKAQFKHILTWNNVFCNCKNNLGTFLEALQHAILYECMHCRVNLVV